MKVWEEMRAVLPEEVTGDWGHFVEIFGRREEIKEEERSEKRRERGEN